MAQNDDVPSAKGGSNKLPNQELLALANESEALFNETFRELQVSGGNIADKIHASIDMKADARWIPDKASDYSYCMVFPEDAEEKGDFGNFTNKLMLFGLELFCFKGRTGKLFVLMRCPLDVIRNYADDINFKMLLDPVKVQEACAAGDAEEQIAPFKIAHDPTVCPYYPYEVIYAKYSKQVPEEMYYRDPVHGEIDPFNNAIRARLVAIMVNSKPKFAGEALKIARRIASGKILAFYPLHMPNELEKLKSVWLSWRVTPWNQPFHAIKEYMGEKLGMYFLFMGHYTRWLSAPAFVGFILQCIIWSYPSKAEGYDAPFLPLFSVFMVTWAILMLQYWKRLEGKAALEWGCAGYEHTQEDRPEFKGEKRPSMVTGEEILYYPRDKRNACVAASYTAVVTMIGLVVGIVAGIYLLRYYLVNGNNGKGGGMAVGDASTIASLINAIMIQVLNYGYQLAAVELTKMENYRTITEQEDALTNKVFAFQFVNSYASLFYLAFFAEQLENGGCGEAGCMYALGFNLIIIFMTALVSGQIFQLVIPYAAIVAAKKMENDEAEEKKSTEPETRPEHEFKLMPYDESDILGDYTSTAIQFGYLALFVTALPLAAPLAWVCNISEVKSDTIKMLFLHQRPMPVMVEDIGAFQGIFTVITMAAVISNGALMKFTMTVLNEESVDTQWWIFVGFQWVTFAILGMAMFVIGDESEALDIQKDRTEYIISKLIDKVGDDVVKSTEEKVDELGFVDYQDYGGLLIPEGEGCCKPCEDACGCETCECCHTFGWDDIVRSISQQGVNAEERRASLVHRVAPPAPPASDL
jgi:anoctamin-10/anoctamin-7